MNYAAAADLVSRFGEYEIEALAPSTDGTTGTFDADKVDSAIADASAEMDTYISQQYVTTGFTAPTILVAVCCDLARYNLYAAKATDEVNTRYQQRISWLRDLAAGKTALDIPGKQVTQATLTGRVTKGTRDRRLSSDRLRHFVDGYRYFD